MEPLHEFVNEYKNQLGKGVIQKAYKGLLEYIQALRTHFKNKYPDYFVSGGIYYGYMDMTYFSVIPKTLKDRDLKIGIVLVHHPLRFEAWLAGYNKQVQAKYWHLIKQSGWNKYELVPSLEGADAILVHTLADDPDFRDLNILTNQIEKGTLVFIQDIENFLSDH